MSVAHSKWPMPAHVVHINDERFVMHDAYTPHLYPEDEVYTNETSKLMLTATKFLNQKLQKMLDADPNVKFNKVSITHGQIVSDTEFVADEGK